MPITRRKNTSTSSSITATTTQKMEQLPLLTTRPSKDDSCQLLTHEESLKLLPWQTDNDYILTGYRRQLYTVKACIRSAFTYIHNETVNIQTHFLGLLFFTIILPLHLIPERFPSFSVLFPTPGRTDQDPLPVPPTLHDKVCLTVYVLCAMGCLGLSSWFHTVQCHSKGMCDAAHRGDYIGIVVLIVGSILPSLYYAFHGDLVLQAFYMTAIVVAGVTSGYIVLSPHHRSHRWHRTLTFIGLGLSSVIPVIHILISQGLNHARERMSLDLVIAGGGCYIVGALMYAARFPERLSPGTFDIFGSSHQIFHIFVLAGAGCQYAALRGMVWGRSMAVGGTGL